jgi:hypothetical protein
VLTESLMFAVVGGMVGLLAVIWSGAWLQRAILPAVGWDPSALIHPSVLGIAALSI